VSRGRMWRFRASGNSFGDYSGLRSLQLGGKLRSGCNNCNSIGICVQFSGRLRPDLDRITQNMSPGQIPPGHVLVHFCRVIAFSRISLLRLSLRPPPSPAISPILPSLRLRRIPYSIVRSCGLTAAFPLHVNPQVRTVCGMPLWALFRCQPVAVSESGS